MNVDFVKAEENQLDDKKTEDNSASIQPILPPKKFTDDRDVNVASFLENECKPTDITPEKHPSSKSAIKREHPDQDRGWAWVVFVATFLGRMIVLGTLLTFNIYFTLFLDIFQQTRGFTSLIGSVLWASYDSTAIFAGCIVNRVGPRITTIVGGCLIAMSLSLSSFANNIYYLIVTMGFAVGLGTQLVSMGCIQGLRVYFKHYQNFVQGVSTAGAGIGMLVLGRSLPIIIDTYGWRGTTLLHGALIFNVCIVGTVMFPVRHYSFLKTRHYSPEESKTSSYLASCAKVFKDWQFWCLFLSYFFFGFSYIIMTVLFHDYITVKGLENTIHTAHSLFAIGDIFGRVGSGVTSCLNIVPLLLSIFTHLLQAAIQFSLIAITVDWELYICSFMYGAATGCANGLFFVVPCDLFQSNDFLIAFPYLSTSAGIGNLIGTPIAGSLTDTTGSYTAALLLGGASAFTAAIFLLPVFIVRWRQSHYEQKNLT